MVSENPNSSNDAVLDRLFDSLGSSDGLVIALRELRGYFCARQILIQTSVFSRGQLGVNIASDGVAADALLEYHSHFEAEDPWTIAAARKGILRTGLVVRGRDLVAQEELHRTRFYIDFLSKHRIEELLTAVLEMPTQEVRPPTVISMHRGFDQMPFSEADAERLRVLLPHLRRAVSLYCRLAPVLSHGTSLEHAFSSMELPMLFLDKSGRIVRANPAALESLKEGRIWRLGESGVLARRDSTGRDWRDVSSDIRNLTDTPHSKHLAAALDGGAAVVEMLRSMRPPPLYNLESPPVALATLRSIELPRDSELVARRFGLTLRELRIGEMIVAGHDAASVSQALEIKLTTVRTHIAAVLAKCSCTNQMQLQARLRGVPIQTIRGLALIKPRE